MKYVYLFLSVGGVLVTALICYRKGLYWDEVFFLISSYLNLLALFIFAKITVKLARLKGMKIIDLAATIFCFCIMIAGLILSVAVEFGFLPLHSNLGTSIFRSGFFLLLVIAYFVHYGVKERLERRLR